MGLPQHFQRLANGSRPLIISVKRLSALIGIIYGRLFFKEKHIAMRLVGGGLMVAGAVLITVWGK